MRKYFIPHRDNQHKPHILRAKAVLKILLFIFLIEAFILIQVFFVIPKTRFFATVLPDVLVDLANTSRQVNNLPGLTTNSLLEQAAQMKAQDMAQKGYFSHNTPDGKTPWYWLEQVDYEFRAAGENLAINFFDSADINNAWMNSESHRANILNSKFTEIGIATANGLYQGRETIFVVQFFGKPSSTNLVLPGKPAKAATLQPPTSPATVQPTPETSPPTQVSQAPAKKPTAVKGTESQETAPSSEELFIEIEGQNKMAVIEKGQDMLPLQESLPPPPKETLNTLSSFRKTFVTPRAITNLVYFIIAAVVFLALLLKVLVRFRIQHPALIFNGVLILIVVGSLIYFNYHLFLSQAKIF